jgi:hypothetical protein
LQGWISFAAAGWNFSFSGFPIDHLTVLPDYGYGKALTNLQTAWQ